MFPSAQAFLDFINARGGPSQVMMLVFNNSYVKVFGDNEVFDPAILDVNTGLFTFVEYDVKDRPFHSYKTIEYIEGVTMAPPGANKDEIYWRNFRP